MVIYTAQKVHQPTPVVVFLNMKAKISCKMSKNKSSNVKCQMSNVQKGFTLIELLLYTSISFIILLIASIFLSTSLQSRVKNQTIAEVEQQGVLVMQLITQTVRNAEGINSPTPGTSAETLSLNVVNNNPSEFTLSNGAVEVTEGVGSAVPLTNSRVIVSELTFQNLSHTDTPGTARVEFTLTHINPDDINEYSFEKTFTGSATIRK